jgi:hypothetical protein
MMTIVLTFVLIALIMLAMAVGVMVSGRRLRGSCGGPGADCQCRADGIPPDSCDRLAGNS